MHRTPTGRAGFLKSRSPRGFHARCPDSQFVNVTLGATEIPFDVAGRDGWNFNGGDTSTITVVGSWCDQIQSSPESVGIVFGCKPPIIP